MGVATASGPRVRGGQLIFTLPDPRRELARVRLVHELMRPRMGPDFVRRSGTWRLAYPRPAVDRLEYRLELTRADGATELVNDPENPLRAPGPFGDKSVVELPGYAPPAWVEADDVPAGGLAPFAIRSRALRADVTGILWASAGSDPAARLPLLVAHDGPEYAEYSSLVRFLDAMVAEGRLPPMRAALLAPIDRDQNYSASAAYARTLANDVLPALGELAPNPPRRRMRVGMGASLGALALVHAHLNHPDLFGGLFLQSGSFFRERWDKHESGFVRFGRITRFVGTVLAGKGADPIDVAMTCGAVEENLRNNRAVRGALASQGYTVSLHENRDAHNWIAWRDTFEPHLLELLQRKWT
jgi:enterochelin esterase-like enzyme